MNEPTREDTAWLDSPIRAYLIEQDVAEALGDLRAPDVLQWETQDGLQRIHTFSNDQFCNGEVARLNARLIEAGTAPVLVIGSSERSESWDDAYDQIPQQQTMLIDERDPEDIELLQEELHAPDLRVLGPWAAFLTHDTQGTLVRAVQPATRIWQAYARGLATWLLSPVNIERLRSRSPTLLELPRVEKSAERFKSEHLPGGQLRVFAPAVPFCDIVRGQDGAFQFGGFFSLPPYASVVGKWFDARVSPQGLLSGVTRKRGGELVILNMFTATPAEALKAVNEEPPRSLDELAEEAIEMDDSLTEPMMSLDAEVSSIPEFAMIGYLRRKYGLTIEQLADWSRAAVEVKLHRGNVLVKVSPMPDGWGIWVKLNASEPQSLTRVSPSASYTADPKQFLWHMRLNIVPYRLRRL